MIRDIFEFIFNRLRGLTYQCDRCAVVRYPVFDVTFIDYLTRKKNGFRYCEWCWNYIHLKKWTDFEGNHHTLRTQWR